MKPGVKILTKLWLIFFLISIAGIGGICLMFYFPVYWLTKPFSRWNGAHDRVLRIGVGVLMRAQPWFAGEVQIELPETQGRGILLISNHRSHLDVFILLSRISGIRILAKKSLFKIPFLSLMMRTSRQIGVERGRLDAWVLAMVEVRQRLRQGERVHVFPEMTRCAPGFKGLQPFTAGPFLAALQEDAVVIPLVFKDTDCVWPKGQHGINFRRPVQVRTLSPVRARDFASVDLLRGEVQKQIEQALL